MATNKKSKKPARVNVSEVKTPVVEKQPKSEAEADTLHKESRKLKNKGYRSFRLSKPIKHTAPKLSPARTLFKNTFVLLWQNKKLFGGILFVYGFTQLVFVKGLIATDFLTRSKLLSESISGVFDEIAGGVSLLTVLLGANKNISADGAVYQTLLLLIASLAIIWALRQVHADATVRIRDAFYKGMYPLIPLLLVVSVVLLQTIPFFFGAWLYNMGIVGGIAVSLIEQAAWIIISGMFVLLTFYLVTSSVIAVYIVTLPDMTPMKALRSAKGLVRYRRLEIFWRVVALSITSLALLGLIMVPIIIVLPGFAPWMFYFVTIGLLALTHAYMYGLYRELLNEA